MAAALAGALGRVNFWGGSFAAPSGVSLVYSAGGSGAAKFEYFAFRLARGEPKFAFGWGWFRD
jgi:hypothetical protein